MILVSSQTSERRPMETFAKLFERFLVFVYHCFDRIVIQGYLPLLTRPEHIVHFFRDVRSRIPWCKGGLIPPVAKTDDFGIQPNIRGGDRWKPSRSFLKASWFLYITVSTASSSRATCRCGRNSD